MLRSGDHVTEQWRTVNRVAGDGRGTTDQTRNLQQFPAAGTNGRMRKQFGREPMFPFRIYQTPPAYLAAPNSATDWLNFCVRGGLYYGTPATGTDGEAFGYDETFPVASGLGTGVIAATSGVSQFWFWLTAAGAVASGATLPGGGVTAIGYVDTTDTTNMVPRIRQIQFGDITGAAASAQQLIIIGDGGDYWNCLSFNNQVYGTVTQPVLKPMKLRAGANGISSETIRGTMFDYTYTGATVTSVTVNGVTYTSQTPYYVRNVTVGGTETDYMIPDPIVGVSTIFALPCACSLNGVPISILAATLASPGTGYMANQVLTLSGGTLSGGTGPAATIKVLTVASGTGAILTCALLTPGQYTTAPGLAGCGVTTGAATFNLTLAPNLIDLNVDGRAWAH